MKKLDKILKPLARTDKDLKYIKKRLDEHLFNTADFGILERLIAQAKEVQRIEENRCIYVFKEFYDYKRSQQPPLTPTQQEMFTIIQKRLNLIVSNRGTDHPDYAKDEERSLKQTLKTIDPLYLASISPDL